MFAAAVVVAASSTNALSVALPLYVPAIARNAMNL